MFTDKKDFQILIQQSIMGNLCVGDAQQTKLGIEDDNLPGEAEEEEFDDMVYDTIEIPRPDVAYDINNLPDYERSEKNLAQLQQKIRLMQANEKKGKKILKITRKYPEGKPLKSPYFLRFMDCIYVGQWVYNNVLNSSIPGGLGRLYKQDEIMEGQFRSFFNENQVQATFASQNLSQILIKQSMKRAKFFGLDTKRVSAESSGKQQKIRVLLDGQGRIFSRTKQLKGTFSEGILHGKGSMVIKEDKDLYEYQGGLSQGKKEGKGIERYRGNLYQGDFRNDMKCGKGILTLFISNKFQEQEKKEAALIEQDNKERDSTKLNLLIQNFIKYRKQQFDEPLLSAISQLKWKGPKATLKNKRFLDDSDFILQHFRRNKFVQYYKGQFKNNLFEGQGRYVWFNGKTHDGSWKEGKMDGYGQFFWHAGGHYYEGQYQNDLKHGLGTMYWGLSKRYRGSWAYGLRHGYGQLITVQTNASVSAVSKNDQKGMEQLKQKLKNETSKIRVIGALFDKDEIKKQYFTKVFQTKIKMQVLSTKFKILNAKVLGVRCDLKDPLATKDEDNLEDSAQPK